MARLSDGCVTLAGFGWYRSGNSSATLAFGVDGGPLIHLARGGLDTIRAYSRKRSQQLSWTATAVPFIPSMPAGSDTTCLQPGQHS